MKQLLLTAALAVSLAGGAAVARVNGVPVHGVHGIHGIIHRCHPTRWNHWCHRHPIGIGPIGRVVGHGPVGVKTTPNHGFPNGIQPEQRVQH